jgi:hypothetical protein
MKLDWYFELEQNTECPFTLMKGGDYILEFADMCDMRLQDFGGET